MKTLLLLCLALLSIQVTYGSHLRGGYIQARSTSTSSTTQEITITLYTDGVAGAAAASNIESISICFGDGTSASATRTAAVASTDRRFTINTYRIAHTYPGPGTYVIATSIANRTAVRNLVNADQFAFALTTTISVNSSILNHTPTFNATPNSFLVGVGQQAIIPFTATDADGDSLVYTLARSLTSSTTNQCSPQPASSFSFPNDLTRRGTFKLNSRTGEIVWNTPVEEGGYSIAVTVNEYRNGALISRTIEEIVVFAVDQPGTPGVVPPYEPASDGQVITALPEYNDQAVTLTVFPNPVEDRLQVVIQTASQTVASIQLLDATGRRLHELTFKRMARQHEQVISMESLSAGTYMLRAEVNGRSLVRKVVKK
ncbi:T9SS type A sorting domain-containing protein [Spirosoma soli]|uniref:T9SS type A sorting domain-containing protein n=1 Tax=Spirosoma soli TaxID=1770529 RepID=A0ABW5M8I2_9BACT